MYIYIYTHVYIALPSTVKQGIEGGVCSTIVDSSC